MVSAVSSSSSSVVYASSSGQVAALAVPASLSSRGDDLADAADEIHRELDDDGGKYTFNEPQLVATHESARWQEWEG
jgi:hypothetical protein